MRNHELICKVELIQQIPELKLVQLIKDNPRYGVSAVNATPIFVYNADTNKLIANYSGMREAAKQLKMSHHTIGKYLNSGKAYKAPIFR